MALRLGIAVAICLCLAGGATAQVVRFETTAGSFDMVLNPTNNQFLQGHVDNMLDYIERESFKGSWVNRAAEGFVLQMGQFFSLTKRPPLTEDMVRRVRQFEPIDGRFGIPGNLNTVGTVAMGLTAPNGTTDPDSATASFFINVADNTNLDADFTVFASIPDMTVINHIMGLQQVSKAADFGSGPSDPTYTDIPVLEDGKQVFIKRAFVLTDALSIAQITAAARSAMAQSASSLGDLSSSSMLSTSTDAPATGLSPTVVPEPASVMLAVVSLSTLATLVRRRRR